MHLCRAIMEQNEIINIYSLSYVVGGFNDYEVFDAEIHSNHYGKLKQRPNDTALNKQIREQLLGEVGERSVHSVVEKAQHKKVFKFACVSGKWHSVAMAIRLSEILEERGLKTKVVHRDIDKEYCTQEAITKEEREIERDMISIVYSGRCFSNFHVNSYVAYVMHEIGYESKSGENYGIGYEKECGEIRHNKHLVDTVMNLLDKKTVDTDTYWSEFHDDRPMNVQILHLPRLFVNHYIICKMDHKGDGREEVIEINWVNFMLDYIIKCKLNGVQLKDRLEKIMKITQGVIGKNIEKIECWKLFKFMFKDLY